MVGTHAALALIAALEHRDRTGRGQLIEVPLVEVATAITAEQVISYSADKTLIGRRGEGGVYACAGVDAWVAVDRAHDPMPAEARAAWCATRAPDVAADELRAAGVPAAALVLAHNALDDRQLQARGYFEEIDNEDVGRQKYPTWPMRMSAGPATWWTGRAPSLGEHNEAVLRDDLGCSEAELERLRVEHVIGSVPYLRA
jgi:crotonobetainyl-CoA:carnitine CoA-transferase CaiB-like acyl-CoA transferase